VVLYIAFVIGPQHWPLDLFLAVGTVNHAYKMLLAVVMIPVIYAVRYGIERYLGPPLAHELAAMAAAAK
jgi:hypothetical protein